MRTMLLTVWLVMLWGSALPAARGQTGDAPGESRRVTLHCREQRLSLALEELFRGSGLRLEISPYVPDVPVTLGLKDVPLLTALRLVTRLADATYSRQGDRYFIGPRRLPATQDASVRVTIEFRDVPFHRALEQLTRSAGVTIIAEPQVPDTRVAASFIDVDFSSVAMTMARLAGATYRKEGNIWVIGMRAPPEPPGDPEPLCTWEFRGVSFFQAIEQMLQGTGESFAVEPEVRNVPIYLFMKYGVRSRPPLFVLTRLAGAALWQEDGVSIIGRLTPPVEGPAATAGTRPAAQPSAKPASKRISLQLEQLPLRQALDVVFRAAGESYRVESSLPERSITVSVRNAEFARVLASTARIAGLAVVRKGEISVICGR